MKEAIANAGIFNIIIVFIIVLMGFFVGSLGYSKAFKVKNMIVNEIEKNKVFDEDVKTVVESELHKIGYRMNTGSNTVTCPLEDGKSAINSGSDFQYCIYKFTSSTKDSDNNNVKTSTYYRVVSYMYFDVPIINELIKMPVKGDTTSFVEINS